MGVESFLLRSCVALGGTGPEILPERGRGGEAAAGELHQAHQRLRQLGVGGGGRHLVLPELDVAARQGFEIGRFCHGATIQACDVDAITPKVPCAAFAKWAQHMMTLLLCCAASIVQYHPASPYKNPPEEASR